MQFITCMDAKKEKKFSLHLKINQIWSDKQQNDLYVICDAGRPCLVTTTYKQALIVAWLNKQHQWIYSVMVFFLAKEKL